MDSILTYCGEAKLRRKAKDIKQTKVILDTDREHPGPRRNDRRVPNASLMMCRAPRTASRANTTSTTTTSGGA